ncbi:MAG TPA: PEGA domain-containing protein, partial [Gemmatimonadaceae bacterium]|nr:PEGA domain-containing protein [Gemmatimonadaceae bacterium]
MRTRTAANAAAPRSNQEAMMLRSVIGTLAVTMLCGCATIIHGGGQDIGFSSTPSAAKVTIDNNPVGQTPVVTHISRKDNHIVRMELDGYQPFEATLTRGTSGWVWGNLVF